MSKLVKDKNSEIRHSDEMQDIITTPPSWLLRWGITLFFGILVIIAALSAIIKYPDIVKAQLKIVAVDAPKAIVAKVSGRLAVLLVKENQLVVNGQPLAYMESTANHEEVLKLLNQLYYLQRSVMYQKVISSSYFNQNINYNLGELQPFYQTFVQSFLTYQSAVKSGFWLKKKAFLQQDLSNLNKQQDQLIAQKALQQQDLQLAREEYQMHQKLAKEKAETPAELRDAESRYVSKQAPLVQTDASLITASSNYDAKQKEMLELDNQMLAEKTEFAQALNSLISQAEDWKNKYILIASQSGKISFAGIVQQNQVLKSGQEVFYIVPAGDNFFGEMIIPQNSMGKVREEQQVLIKLHSYPFEEYGMIRGHITSLADAPYQDSIFLAKVEFNLKKGTDLKRPINLKQGMLADAEIITENATIMQRITRNLMKAVQSR